MLPFCDEHIADADALATTYEVRLLFRRRSKCAEPALDGIY